MQEGNSIRRSEELSLNFCGTSLNGMDAATTISPAALPNTQLESHSTRSNHYDVISIITPLMQNITTTETQKKSLGSFTRKSNLNGENSNSHLPDSFVIDFENTDEGLSRSPVQLIKPLSNGQNGTFQIDHAALEIGINSQQNTEPIYRHITNAPVNDGINLSNNISNAGSINSGILPQHTEGSSEAQSGNSGHEIQSLDKFISKYFPFITFLLMKIIIDHREGIFIFVGLMVTFAHANSVVKREIAKQSRRSFMSLLILIGNLFVCICFIYFVFRDQKLYKCLLFIPPYNHPLNIWDLLWLVGITDFILKFITIQIKAGVACLSGRRLPYSSRGKWYLMLECSSQLYRSLAPIQPWLYYLMEAYQGSEKIVGVIFSLAYVFSKGKETLSKAKIFLRAIQKLWQKVSLGVHPSKEELDVAGSLCPICHDEYNMPELLRCKHVFCESCIATWFDREQTCPLCRAKITDDPCWRDGATTYFVQLF